MTVGARNVAIIGAGVAGLATAKTLLAEGVGCTVYERGAELGGVWADGYVNFGVQVQKELYQFPDWPLPEGVENFTPGPVFRDYLESYCDHFGIRPHLRLRTRVLSLEPRADGAKGWDVVSETDGEETRASHDLVVVATGLYSESPNIPEIPDRESYAGEVMHISQIKQTEQLAGRKVVVTGYGKSATDIACEAAGVADEVHLVFRRTHWPVPRKLAGLIPFKWGMLNRLTAAVIQPYVRPGPVERWLHIVARPLPWLFWRIVALLLRVQFGLGTRIAGGKNLVPSKPVEIDCFGESTMVPRPEFMGLIKSGRIIAHRTWIERYLPDGVLLEDGERLKADQIVFGTGWRTGYGFLPESVHAALPDDGDGFYLYRHILHPDAPGLAFIGRASSFLSVTTYSIQARWLAELIAGRVNLPGRDEMLSEIDRIRAWKQSWIPASSARSARLLLHMAHYHDELLRDFGADPFRKRGFFAPFKELMAPYQSSDFRDIAAGTFAKG